MSDASPTTAESDTDRSPRTLRALARYFAGLGASGFGGPIALVGYMQRDLVDRRRWYSQEEFNQALAVGQTFPGPLAAQVAMWLGYLERGAIGAAAVGVPFVLAPFLIVTGAAVAYARFEGTSLVQDLFFGIGPAVLAIVAVAAVRLAQKTNTRDMVLWTIAAILCTTTALSGAEIVWLFLLAGAFGAVWYGGGLPNLHGSLLSAPLPIAAAVAGLAWSGTAGLGSLGAFFVKAGAFTFGSGLAIVPFLHAGLVDDHGWLTEQQFLDTVAMGLISPGPVVIMATFAGYLAGGLAGAIVATVAVFLPVYLFVAIPGRLVRRHERHPCVQGFIKGATAAASGAIAGAAIVIARQTIGTPLAGLIALAALALLLQPWRRLPEPGIVAAAALAGTLLHG